MNQWAVPTTTTATFVLRFWRETTAGEVRWRGSIKHIQSGEEIAFFHIEIMLNFLRRYGIQISDRDQASPEKM